MCNKVKVPKVTVIESFILILQFYLATILQYLYTRKKNLNIFYEIIPKISLRKKQNLKSEKNFYSNIKYLFIYNILRRKSFLNDNLIYSILELKCAQLKITTRGAAHTCFRSSVTFFRKQLGSILHISYEKCIVVSVSVFQSVLNAEKLGKSTGVHGK